MSDDDTFVSITNRKIYDAVQSLETRVMGIEFRLENATRRASLVLPAVSALAAVMATLLTVKR